MGIFGTGKSLLNKRKKTTPLYFLIGVSSVIFLFLVWQALAVTVFKDSKALPTPLEVFARLLVELQTKKFYKGIGRTLFKSVISFSLSLVFGTVLALGAVKSHAFESFLRPIMNVFRSVPTQGIVFILFMFYSGSTASVIVGMLISLPLSFSSIMLSLVSTDKRLLEMASVYKLSRFSQFKNILLPSAMPHLYTLTKSGFILNLKVIIAAEILAIPRMSLGSFLSGAYIAGDFVLLFMWVLVAILLSFLIELVCDFGFKLCMPYKYDTRKNLIKVLKRIGLLFKRRGGSSDKA